MNKLLALFPKSKAIASTPILAALLALGGYLTDIEGMDPNVQGVMLGLIVVAVLGVHLSGVKSNADGTDAREAYKPE